jgi:phosphate transport system substrate-binding protein
MKIQTSSVVALSLLAGLVAATPKVLAEPETKFPLPSSVPDGTKIKLSGSQSLEGLNTGLQDAFKKKFAGSEVLPPTYTSTSKGLEALAKGEVDLIGAGRLLTPEEKAKGFGVKTIGVEKIAIVVSDKNTLIPKGNIGFDQFAKIYNGEIQDWSKVGGTKGAIKVIDQTDISDTRQAFGRYNKVFKGGLKTGNNVIKLTDNSAKSVAEKLGTNGIGYLPVSQVKGLPGVKVLSLNNVQPSDPRYAFSQPMSYVYPKDKLSEGAKALLGFVDSPEGAATIATVPGITALGSAGTAPASAPGDTKPETANSAAPKPKDTATETGAAGATATGAEKGGGLPWWLIPLGLGAAGLGWWALAGGKKKETVTQEPKRLNPLYSENDVKPTGTTGFTTGTTGFTNNRDSQDSGIPLSGDLSLPTNVVEKTGSAATTVIGGAKDQAGDLLKGAALAGGGALAGGSALAGGLGKGVVDKSASLSGDLSGELPRIDIGNPLEGLKQKASDLTPDLNLGNPITGGASEAIEGLKDKAGDLGNSVQGLVPDVGNPLGGLGDKAGDLLKGTAIAGGAAVAGGAAMAGGLFGNKDGEKSGDLKAKADESTGFNLGNLGQGIKDKVGDVVQGGQDLGGAAIAGGAAVVGGTAAAIGAGTQSLWGNNDDHSGELSLEDSSYETEISALNQKPGDLNLPTPDPFDDSMLSEPMALPEIPEVPERSGGFNPFDAIGELKDKAVDAAQGGGAAVVGGAAAAAGAVVGAGAAAKSFVTGDSQPEASGLLQQEGQITLVSPNPAQAYVHWDVPVKLKRQLRQQGGRKLAVRMYDVTDTDITTHLPSNFQEFECDELAWDLHLPVPRADRKYLVEIGYVSEENAWLMLARSTPVMIRSNA